MNHEFIDIFKWQILKSVWYMSLFGVSTQVNEKSVNGCKNVSKESWSGRNLPSKYTQLFC